MSELIDNGAVLSPDLKHRYNLWRIWETGKPFALFIGLNPSTADHTKDDPTVRRCKQFALDWGYGGFHIVNLFGYRATKPTDMIKQADPVGLKMINIYAARLKRPGSLWQPGVRMVDSWEATAAFYRYFLISMCFVWVKQKWAILATRYIYEVIQSRSRFNLHLKMNAPMRNSIRFKYY